MHHLIHLSLFIIIICHSFTITHAFTNEPPGRDPASIDQIRSSEKAISINSENFDEVTAGKIIFIKFYSPSCPHCKNMAAAWNELAMHYNDDNTTTNNDKKILIGSIDCTDSPKGKDLCEKFQIVGLPTLLYGDASFGGVYLNEYSGDKTFADLKTFAVQNLVPTCNPGNLDACPLESRQEIEQYIDMSYEELHDRILVLEKNLEELKKSYAEKFASLQKVYDEIVTEKEIMIVRAKASMKLIHEVIEMKEVQ